MNRFITLGLVLLLMATMAQAMVGGPVFTIGQKMSGMTVEATQTKMELSSSSGSETFGSQRVMLTARYGLLNNLDCSAQVGGSNISFEDLPAGYSEFSSDWAFAWGGSLRAELPGQASPFEVIAALNYFGFQPKGKIDNGTKTISSSYLWHEVSPSLSVGYATGAMIPYVGVMKPYLFGKKDVEVSFNGQEFPAAGGRTTYTDGDQSIRGLLGIEWRWPDGYSVCAEAAAGGSGLWTISLGLPKS